MQPAAVMYKSTYAGHFVLNLNRYYVPKQMPRKGERSEYLPFAEKSC